MTQRGWLRGVVLVVLVVLLCGLWGLWWMYEDLEARHAEQGDQLSAARALREEVRALREIETSNRRELDALAALLIRRDDEEIPDSESGPVETPSLSALRHKLEKLDAENKQFARQLEETERGLTEARTQLTARQAQINQGAVELARVNGELKQKTESAVALDKQLVEVRKQLDAGRTENTT
ncbi:MAG TPA: hypothetical protein VMY39_07080, partial [Planctomycetota bacterium]|nr:hypothetical protein [Planctomycetota bacterium]